MFGSDFWLYEGAVGSGYVIVLSFDSQVVGMQITGSLARKAIKELMAKGTIRLIAAHANQQI